MIEQERYEQVDMPFYRDVVAPCLPPKVLDYHAHIWTKAQWKEVPWEEKRTGAKYMVVETEYGVDTYEADVKRIIPDRPYHGVCFGMPTPAADLEKTNDYVAEIGQREALYPLIVTGKDILPQDVLEQKLKEGGFHGYKVFLNWFGNDYQDIRIEHMIGPKEMALAEKYRLIILFHVPTSERLAHPEVQAGIRNLSKEYPNAQIVLAHCGRCYTPDEMKAAIGSIADLENVYMDTAMVMDPLAIQIALENIDSKRMLYATDLPVANMRGRRVYVMDHWVDLVLDGYPESAFRVGSDNFRASFMVYEIMLAIHRGAERAGLSAEKIKGIFWNNGMGVLGRVQI